jgi:hypothetical protein
VATPQAWRRMTSRQRCSECRQWYYPARSAKGSQVVCGESCRRVRRNRLARRRRAERLEEARLDERQRQRECRGRRRGSRAQSEARAGPGENTHEMTQCHAPASACKSSELRSELRIFWDTQARRSRATLERELGRIARETHDFVGRSLAKFETRLAAVTSHPAD